MNKEIKEWVHLDMETIEEKPLTAAQKQQIKRNIHIKKAPKRSIKVWVSAAALGLCVLTGSYVALPTIASQVPFIENIMTRIDPNFIPQNYVNLATVIHQVESSNGIDMMIENAVYDGNTLMVTYAIKTEHDLGEQPSTATYLDIEGATGMSGVSSLEKIEKDLYTGMMKVTPHFEKAPGETIQIRWQPEKVTNIETGEEFAGDWSFAFTMDALPVTKQSVIAKSASDDAELHVKQVDFNELTTVIHYEFTIDPLIKQKYPLASVDIVKVTDNFGKEHEIHGNGGIITEEGFGHDWSLTLYTLSDEVTSITVTPEIYYVKESGEVTANMRKLMEPVTVNLVK